ncbi:hypothetical protein, partial [Brevibacillus sp. SIMBA_040]|uniref:hypothetical protein n=1 Tax=Brevibacillus sp. SIMBA_040 TaxID=3085781 RepID=UPI0039782B10
RFVKDERAAATGDLLKQRAGKTRADRADGTNHNVAMRKHQQISNCPGSFRHDPNNWVWHILRQDT